MSEVVLGAAAVAKSYASGERVIEVLRDLEGQICVTFTRNLDRLVDGGQAPVETDVDDGTEDLLDGSLGTHGSGCLEDQRASAPETISVISAVLVA